MKVFGFQVILGAWMTMVNQVLVLGSKKSFMAVLTFRSAQELHHQFQHQPQTLLQQQPKRQSQQKVKINQPSHQQQKQQQMKLRWSYTQVN